MAPLLKSLYRPSQRSLLSSLFTATFLGAVVVVAFPCPVRPTNLSGRAEAMLDSNSNINSGETDARTRTGTGTDRRSDGQVVVLMNRRGRRFLEESWVRDLGWFGFNIFWDFGYKWRRGSERVHTRLRVLRSVSPLSPLIAREERNWDDSITTYTHTFDLLPDLWVAH
jgi:hypothetical protein